MTGSTRMCAGAESISSDGDLLVATFLHGIMPSRS